MANLLINTALRWLGSKVPTAMMPLSDISEITVILDAEADDAAEAAEKVTSFFNGKDIAVSLVSASPGRCIRADKDTQVLLSLLPDAGWKLEFAVRCSRARFKIGRRQLPGEPFDLVVSDPEGVTYPQTEVFFRMMEIVSGLK